MAQGKNRDKYANVARATVTQSSSDTETFQELLTGISLGQGVGMLIDQIDYYIGSVHLEKIKAATDSLVMGWCTSDTVGSLAISRRTTIHVSTIENHNAVGTPTNAGNMIMPLLFQFFPPIIVAAPRLFLGCDSTSLGTAAKIDSRFYFRYIDLTAQEYLELAETFILVQ